MSRFGVTAKKEAELYQQMAGLNIREEDLEEKFITARGPGGQKTSHSCTGVYLKHIPTGLEVKMDQSRSLGLNRFYARRRLCELLEFKQRGADSTLAKRVAKIRKQKNRRSRRAKEKYGWNLKNEVGNVEQSGAELVDKS